MSPTQATLARAGVIGYGRQLSHILPLREGSNQSFYSKLYEFNSIGSDRISHLGYHTVQTLDKTRELEHEETCAVVGDIPPLKRTLPLLTSLTASSADSHTLLLLGRGTGMLYCLARRLEGCRRNPTRTQSPSRGNMGMAFLRVKVCGKYEKRAGYIMLGLYHPTRPQYFYTFCGFLHGMIPRLTG